MCFWSNPDVAKKLAEEDATMTVDLFDKVMSQAKDHLNKFGLTDSGEFMMDPHWVERISTITAIAKEHPDTMFHQITNASLLTKKRIEKLKGLKQVTLLISIESMDPVNYASLRHPGKLEKVLSNIRNLRKNFADIGITNIQLQLSTVLMKRTISDIPKLIEFAKEIDAFLFVDHVQGFGPKDLHTESMFNYPAFCNSYLAKCKSYAESLDVQIYIPPPIAIEPHEVSEYFEAKKQAKLSCSSIDEWGPIAIMPNGDMKVCCGELVFGNLHTSTFEEVFFSQKFTEYRKAISAGTPLPPCDSCRFLFMSSPYLYESEVYDLTIPPEQRCLDRNPDLIAEGFFNWIHDLPEKKLRSHLINFRDYEFKHTLGSLLNRKVNNALKEKENRRELLKLIEERSQVIVYPAGSRAQEIIKSKDELLSYCNIIALSDKDPQKQSRKILGLNVIPPEQIGQLNPVTVIIVVSKTYEQDIIQELQHILPRKIRLMVL